MTSQRGTLTKTQMIGLGSAAALLALIIAVGAITEDDPPATPANTSTPTSATTTVPTTTAPAESTPSPTDSQAELALTAKNSKDLAALLTAKNASDKAQAFATKYEGQTIEFDGTIAAMNNHGNYKTRYDLLIIAGNSAEGTSGPNFQFRDVNLVSDLKLSGANIPDTIGVGDKLRVTAQVKNYEENTDLFLLEPVSTEGR
jgi:hypothetical protein